MESCEPGPSSTESYEHLPCCSSLQSSVRASVCLCIDGLRARVDLVFQPTKLEERLSEMVPVWVEKLTKLG